MKTAWWLRWLGWAAVLVVGLGIAAQLATAAGVAVKYVVMFLRWVF